MHSTNIDVTSTYTELKLISIQSYLNISQVIDTSIQ